MLRLAPNVSVADAHDDRQHRAGQDRPDRHRGPAAARLQRQPQPGDPGGAQAGAQARPDHGRPAAGGLQAGGDAVRRLAVADHDG